VPKIHVLRNLASVIVRIFAYYKVSGEVAVIGRKERSGYLPVWRNAQKTDLERISWLGANDLDRAKERIARKTSSTIRFE
jgi:hypothetical protein